MTQNFNDVMHCCPKHMGNIAPLWKESVMLRFNEGHGRTESLLEDLKSSSFSPCVCHNVCESSALQELHDDPELISHQVAVVHLHHVLMMIVPHDNHLQKHRDGQTQTVRSLLNQ